MILLPDSNALLTPALSYYAFDICGGYWDWIAKAATDGTVKSISPIKRELRNKDDQIKNWIDFYATDLFLPDNAAIKNTMGQVATWAGSNDYTSAAVADFLSKADSYLIAYVMLGKYQIVTLETSAPNSRNRIKIPDAGNAFGISSITPYQMLRQHKVHF